MINKVIYIVILIGLAGIIGFRYRQISGDYEKLKDGQVIAVKGRLTSQPYQINSKQYIEVGRFSAYVDPYPQFNYRDELEIVGTLKIELINKRVKKFRLVRPTITLIENDQSPANPLKPNVIGLISRLRQNIVEKIKNWLPEPQASLLTGIVLGVKSGFAPDFYEALRRTGTLHVVVASGYNISVVAGVLASFTMMLMKRRQAVPWIFGGIIFYTLLTGAEPPIVRAAIMGSVAFLAQLSGRQYHGLLTLAAAVLVMLVVSPLLLFETGFQLSVAATLGILALTPAIVRLFPKSRSGIRRGLAEETAVVLGAQLAVLPILLIQFKNANWLSPLINLLVVNLVPVIMGLGGVAIAAGLIWNWLGQAAAYLAYGPLWVFVLLVNGFSRMPFGNFAVDEVSWWWGGAYYLVIFGFIYLVQHQAVGRRAGKI